MTDAEIDLLWGGVGLRYLDVDSENHPGFYWYDGKPTDILHTVACMWTDEPSSMQSWTTEWTPDDGLHIQDLSHFWTMWNEADVIVGHNFIRHDLPLLNAHRLRNYGEPLEPKRVLDTLLVGKTKGVSKSQENLATMFDLVSQKPHLALPTWEAAAAGEPWAIEIVVNRCREDVRQNTELFHALRREGWLPKTKFWRP